MDQCEDIDDDPTSSDVAGQTADVAWSEHVPELPVGGDDGQSEPSDTEAGWCPDEGDLGLEAFTSLDTWAVDDDAPETHSRVDGGDTSSRGDEPAAHRSASDHEDPGPGDDLGARLFEGPDADGHGTVLHDDPPDSLGPLGFDFGERGPIEQAEYEAAQADVPYAPIEDRELAAHAHEIEALHGFDFAHAEIEHEVQQSLDASASSPVWMSRDEVAHNECEVSQAVAEEMDREGARIEHAAAEERAGASLVPPEVAAHLQELDRLGLETDVAHARSEVDAQQSQPTEPVPDATPPGSGVYWGIRVVGGASVSIPAPNVGPSLEKAVLEIKNLTTGEVGVFDAVGAGLGMPLPSVDIGTGEWTFFRTADDQQLDDFAGRASLSSVTFFDTGATIRFADPDSWLPLIGDIDVEHDNLAESIALGDSVDISDSAQHVGGGVSASIVKLSLAWSYWEAPEPDLVDIVKDATQDVDGDR